MSKWEVHIPEVADFNCVHRDGQAFFASPSSAGRLEEIVGILNAHDDLVAALTDLHTAVAMHFASPEWNAGDRFPLLDAYERAGKVLEVKP